METAAKPRLAIPNDRSKVRRPVDAEPLFVVSPEKTQTSAALRIADEAHTLTSFLTGVEARIRQLRAVRAIDRRGCAEEVLAILREIVRFECDISSFESALPQLLSELWAEAHIRDLVESLYANARMILHPGAPLTLEHAYVPEMQITLLDYFVDWYSRRKSALNTYADHPLCDAGDVLILGIVHDRIWLDQRGCEVVASVRVDGLEFQTLWLRVLLYREEKPISLRAGWHFWADDPELFALPSGGERPSVDRFASVVPIVPCDQRAVYDQVKLFIPYAALDLPPQSRQQIDYEIALITSTGQVLSSDACSETVAIPEVRRGRAIPSPAALGFWPQAIGRGDSIDLKSVELTRRFEARRETRTIDIEFDVFCVKRESEELSVEVRFLTSEGNLVESHLSGFSAGDGTFIHRQHFIPDAVVARAPCSRCTIPLTALELDAGQHDLLVELTLIDRENRIVCGTLEFVRIEVRGDLTQPQEPCSEEQGLVIHQAIDSALSIAAVRIESGHRFNMRDALKVEVSLLDLFPRGQFCQLRVAVEALAAKSSRQAPLMRALLVPRTAGQRELTRIFSFDSEEVLAQFAGHHSRGGVRIVVEVLDSRHTIILSTEREIELSDRFGRERNAHTTLARTQAEVEIVDVAIRSTPQRGGESLMDLILNMDPRACERGSYTLYCEPIIPGKTFNGAAHPDGCMVEIDMISAAPTLIALAVLQEHRAVRLPAALSGSGLQGVKLMLFSPTGRLVQVVYQRIDRQQNPLVESTSSSTH